MANFERGVYEPSDEVRVFDGSEEEDDVEGSRLPLLIVLALLVLAMFAGVVWLAYTQGVARGRGETPVLTANGPERVAPQAGGDGTVPYQGFKIYEQPAPADDTADTPAKPAANAAPAVTPAPKPVAQKPPAPPAPVVAKPATPPPAPVKAAAATPAPNPAAPAPAKSVAALIQQANSPPAAPKPATPLATAKAATAPPPAMKQAVIPPVAAATAAPRTLVAPTEAPAAPVMPKPAATAPTGTYVLQIGAYKSQADADTAWKTYKAKHGALLSGYSDDIQQADLGEKGTWYRLRIGGLSNKEVATALCDRLKADGGACILGR
jgi:cell division protein FtsN